MSDLADVLRMIRPDAIPTAEEIAEADAGHWIAKMRATVQDRLGDRRPTIEAQIREANERQRQQRQEAADLTERHIEAMASLARTLEKVIVAFDKNSDALTTLASISDDHAGEAWKDGLADA